MAADSSLSPKLFVVQDGAVTGTTGQEDANAFAADFQGLRHFGNRVGEALDLGDTWLGAYREADFTHLWVLPNADSDTAMGAMLPQRSLFSQMLQHATSAEI